MGVDEFFDFRTVFAVGICLFEQRHALSRKSFKFAGIRIFLAAFFEIAF